MEKNIARNAQLSNALSVLLNFALIVPMMMNVSITHAKIAMNLIVFIAIAHPKATKNIIAVEIMMMPNPNQVAAIVNKKNRTYFFFLEEKRNSLCTEVRFIFGCDKNKFEF